MFYLINIIWITCAISLLGQRNNDGLICQDGTSRRIEKFFYNYLGNIEQIPEKILTFAQNYIKQF